MSTGQLAPAPGREPAGREPDIGLRPGYAYTDRGVIHYVEAGAGEPLLLLHATPGSHRAFRYLIPLLALHFRTIAVDTPGYGNSDPLPGEVTIESISRSLVGLLDALSLPRAHLLGLHTGNKIAAAMAGDFPDRVSRVVLAGQTHSLIVDRAERDAAIRALVDPYFAHFNASRDGSQHVRRWLMARTDVESLWWPSTLLRGERVTDETVDVAESMVIDYLLGWKRIVATYEAVFAFDLADALRRVASPTLVLELIPADEVHFGAQAPVICAMVRDARSVTLAGEDAGAFRTRPGIVADAVLPFLAQSR